MDKKLERKRIWVFIALIVIITFPIEFGFADFVDRTKGTGAIFVMLIPTICMLLTRLFTKEGFRDMWLKPRPKKGIRYILLAWYGMIVLILIGTVIYYLCFPSLFDPTMSGTSAAFNRPASQVKNALVSGLFIIPLLLDVIFGAGEEWGWRGYLLPKLLQLHGIIPSVIISGVIWALWHLPLMIIESASVGINPMFSVMHYLILCQALSMIFAYITLKSGSILPAAFAHQSYNLYLSMGVLYMVEGEATNYSAYFVWGILLIVGVCCMMWMHKEEKQGLLLIMPGLSGIKN